MRRGASMSLETPCLRHAHGRRSYSTSDARGGPGRDSHMQAPTGLITIDWMLASGCHRSMAVATCLVSVATGLLWACSLGV